MSDGIVPHTSVSIAQLLQYRVVPVLLSIFAKWNTLERVNSGE
jgi:hypothetical protein